VYTQNYKVDNKNKIMVVNSHANSENIATNETNDIASDLDLVR